MTRSMMTIWRLTTTTLPAVLAWVLLGLGVLALWIGLIGPTRAHFAELENREVIALAQVENLERRLGTRPVSIKRAPNDLTYRDLSAPLATAALLSYVSDAVERADGTVQSVVGRLPEDIENGFEVSVQIDAEMPLEALANFLLDLETIRPLSIITLLDVAGPRSQAEMDPEVSAPLAVRLVVTSLASEAS